jgi:hypothetical protein
LALLFVALGDLNIIFDVFQTFELEVVNTAVKVEMDQVQLFARC